MKYPAIFSYETGKGIAVFFPDLDVATSGVHEIDAILSAGELLDCVLRGLRKDCLPIPEPSDPEKIIIEDNEKVVLVMSDFREFLAEQLKDPEFRRWWEARNEMILQRTAGTMALSGMELTEKDKERIMYLCEHPDEMDAMLEALIREHTVDTKIYEESMEEHKKNPVTYSHEQVGKIIKE